jgi:aryl-alcohol dehydrogenase-like predicted oxidoreductase
MGRPGKQHRTVEMRTMGRTGMKVSVLGFGCGAVGGLMVRGEPRDQEAAVARAIELGVNYFDTAAMYGDGESEKNLGRVLAVLRPNVFVATKTKVDPATRGAIRAAIFTSADKSLQRLRRDQVDVFQLHTPVMIAGEGDALDFQTVVDEVLPAFEALRQAGKIRFYGFSATGAAATLPRLIDTGAFDVAQVIYNLLNSSAGAARYDAVGPDFGNALTRAQTAGMGTVAIRVLAAGALSGSEERHSLGSPDVAPMGSGADYRSDVERAKLLLPLVSEGHVATLAEAALRFAISDAAVSTALVGFSEITQVEVAAAAIERGPLPQATLDRIGQLL